MRLNHLWAIPNGVACWKHDMCVCVCVCSVLVGSWGCFRAPIGPEFVRRRGEWGKERIHRVCRYLCADMQTRGDEQSENSDHHHHIITIITTTTYHHHPHHYHKTGHTSSWCA